MPANDLIPYLPELVVEWFVGRPDLTHRELSGTIVYVDISGFTRLSERLATRGRIGAEDVAETIGSCFRELLAIAYADGAGLLKFGGDALLLWFSGDDHALRACRSAVGMRRRLRDVGRLDVLGRRIVLRMSVGIHSGDFGFFLVGESHRELVVTGAAATTTVLMESTAEAGDILVSAATAAALPPAAIGAPKGEGVLLRPFTAAHDDGYHPRIEVPETVDLAQCVPVGLRHALQSGEHQAEHRRATVAFLRFTGVEAVIENAGLDAFTARLTGLVSTVQRAVDRHQIAFLGSDVDRDGGKIILTAGVPSTAGDDEHRMLMAVREIVDAEPALPLQIGVNRGDVFAGDIGPEFRRTYTVMGDTVNLAARVMARAEPGELLATRAVLERSERFDTVALEPFTVKGKSNLVHASRVGPPRAVRAGEVDSSVPMTGRELELTTLLDAADEAERGRGRLVELVGEPGLGKSRLLYELGARRPALAVRTLTCEPYSATTPYEPFRPLMLDLLGVTPGTAPATSAQRIRDALTEVDAGLAPWSPLVAGMLDVPMPDTAETDALELHFRPTRLAEVVAQFLGHAFASPTLLVVEDSHWMDDASAALLEHLAADVGTRPWLVCVARRDEATGFVSEDPARLVLRLRPLAARDAAALVDEATIAVPVAPHLAAMLVERAGGNPLFLKELLDTVRSGDTLEALPDSVEAVIASRIDQLATRDRALLRRASVLGRAFPPADLRAVLDDVPSADDPVWHRLEPFLRPDRDDRGDQLRFDHALVRDSAYDGLPFRLRRELHGRAGDVIRARAADPDSEAELLSLHYFAAHRHDEAYRFSRVAAIWARDIYANVEATEFYQRALTSARELDLDRADVAAVAEALGDMHDRTGSYAEAETAYRAARRLVVDDPVADARLILKLAKVHGVRDKFARALRWITRGLRRLDGVAGTAAARQRAQLRAFYSHFSQNAGRHTTAITWCGLAIAEAEAAGDDEALALALSILDLAYMDLGRLDEPVNLPRALALYEGVGDLASAAGVLNRLGGIAYWRGHWTDAIGYYERAEAMVIRTGNAVFQAFCRNNTGEVFYGRGALDDARECFVQARRIWRAAGYRSGICAAGSNLAPILALAGDTDGARTLLDESLADAQDSGDPVEVVEARTRLVELALIGGDPALARDDASETLRLARGLGGVAPPTPALHRLRAVAAFQLGDRDAAAAALGESVAAATTRSAAFELALSLRTLDRLGLALDSDQQSAARDESSEIFRRLGVTSVLDWHPTRGGALNPV